VAQSGHGDTPRKELRQVQVWHHDMQGSAPSQAGRLPVINRCVATIGVFDGVHRGHQRMVHRTLARAAELRLPAVAVTFDPLPETVLRPGSAPPLLTTFERRLELLADLGLDGVYVVHFDSDFAQLTPAEFATSVLVDALRAVDVLVGENFRFGRRASGDVATLTELGSAAGFMVDEVSLAHPAGGDAPPFSSTWIRERIAAGDVVGGPAGGTVCRGG
jgi:riboflavin kinase/FMN adenylyltransferase